MGEKLKHHTQSVYPLESSKFSWLCMNRWIPIFLTWVYACWHPMHLKSLRVNEKQLESITWTWSSMYVINYFYYIYIVCYYIDIFLS
jgi:hypothetical protein